MTLSVLGDVNWLAVLVATVLYFGLGGLWYSPVLFAKPWMRAIGMDAADENQGSPAMYLVPLATCLVSTVVVAMLAYGTGTDTVAEGLVLGLVVGIGVTAAVTVSGIFDPKNASPVTVAAINAGYHLLGVVLASLIIGAWA